MGLVYIVNVDYVLEVVLRHFHQYCYKGSPLWFVVGENKALVCTRWINTRVYMVRVAGA
jgi:hypothetical protein